MAEYDLESGKQGQESLVQKVFRSAKTEFRSKQDQYVRLFIVAGIASIYISSIMMQSFLSLAGVIPKTRYNPISILYYFLFKLGWVIGVPMFAMLCFIVIAFWTMRKKPYEYDERRNVYVSESGDGGSARFMDEATEEEVFYRARKIEDTDKAILGRDKRGLLCARKPIRYSNANSAIIGSPGCGKSACIVFPHIFQCIRRGESFVVTDSKGDIYRQSVYLAQKAGYNVKVLNLKPRELKYSDGMQLMKTVRDRMGAATMANIVIENTKKGDKQDFWDEAANNLLTALILYVRFSTVYKKNEKTLVQVYKLLIDNSVKELEQLFATIRPDSPGYEPAMTYSQSPDTVKTSAYQGLAIKLALFQQPAVQQILMNDEIDLRAPLSERCAYYIVISDTDNTAKFLSCLFFTTLFNELMDEADRVFNGNPPIDVQFILDEFKATGSIPAFDNILSVARSRHLNIEFILQDITQLQAMYPDGWRTVMNNCTTWMLLRAREEETLEYFSAITGEHSTYSEAHSYSENKFDVAKLHPNYNVRGSLGKRRLCTVDDLYNMSDDEVFLSIQGRHRFIYLQKFNYWEHPMYEVVHKFNHLIPTTDHIPEWRQRLLDQGLDLDDGYGEDEEEDSVDENAPAADTESVEPPIKGTMVDHTAAPQAPKSLKPRTPSRKDAERNVLMNKINH